jgi:GT2 family glycosyltransferase
VSFASGIGHGLWTFLRTYVVRLGFLDGREGFLLAVANAEGAYYRYMKAWLLARGGRFSSSGTGPAGGLVSVIVTTYNREDALDAVLRGLAGQSDHHFEVIVADDGSGPGTQRLIAAWSAAFPAPIKHVRHDHAGFRGGEIRNRGIRASDGALCIFLDGDCIPAPDFVARHRRLAEPGWFVTGNRILLSRSFTEKALAKELPVERWRLSALVGARLSGKINRLLPALRLPLGSLRKLGPAGWGGAQTCNLAVARADLDRIDGFDAAFRGWGLEDSDLVVRLIRAGVRRKDGRFATGVFHLWHPRNDRSQFEANQARLDETLRGSRVRAHQGLSALNETERAVETMGQTR